MEQANHGAGRFSRRVFLRRAALLGAGAATVVATVGGVQRTMRIAGASVQELIQPGAKLGVNANPGKMHYSAADVAHCAQWCRSIIYNDDARLTRLALWADELRGRGVQTCGVVAAASLMEWRDPSGVEVPSWNANTFWPANNPDLQRHIVRIKDKLAGKLDMLCIGNEPDNWEFQQPGASPEATQKPGTEASWVLTVPQYAELIKAFAAAFPETYRIAGPMASGFALGPQYLGEAETYLGQGDGLRLREYVDAVSFNSYFGSPREYWWMQRRLDPPEPAGFLLGDLAKIYRDRFGCEVAIMEAGRFSEDPETGERIDPLTGEDWEEYQATFCAALAEFGMRDQNLSLIGLFCLSDEDVRPKGILTMDGQRKLAFEEWRRRVADYKMRFWPDGA